MIQVCTNLFVGSEYDYRTQITGTDCWAVVHACKEPYHREALGYSGRGAPKDHPEYLVARRGDRLILNMVDANDPALFAKEMINQALDFIDEQLAVGHKVLVHCNQGESRAPSIALLYMACRLHVLPTDSLEAAEHAFVTKYPGYNPKPGIREHLRQNWRAYCE